MKHLLVSASAIGLCVLLFSPSPRATLVPPLDIESLTSHADLVAVGRIAQIFEEGPITLQMQGTAVEGHAMRAHLEVERIIKGHAGSESLMFRFALPDAPAGYLGIGKTEFGVFFLRKGTQGWEILDPHHPFVIAAPGAPRVTGRYTYQVIAEVVWVFESPTATPDARLRAILVLDSVRIPLATAGLIKAAAHADLRVRAWALRSLLRRNVTSVLDSAERFMLSGDPKIDQTLRGVVASGLADGVKDPQAIPALGRLLQSSDTNVRRAAAAALRNTQDQKAIQPLTQALNDTDREVQYQAVIGLAEITGAASEWSPATDTFNQDAKRYLDYWREWAKARKQPPK